MIWSEATSGDYVGEKGVCGTHDMETFNRFKSTKVRCALVPRELEVKEFTDVLQTSFAAGTYTHHQKTIVVDAENAGSGSGSRYDQSRGTGPSINDIFTEGVAQKKDVIGQLLTKSQNLCECHLRTSLILLTGYPNVLSAGD